MLTRLGSATYVDMNIAQSTKNRDFAYHEGVLMASNSKGDGKYWSAVVTLDIYHMIVEYD